MKIKMNKKSLIESLKGQGFSKEILKAFSEVKREKFISQSLKAHAYEDNPLPIGHSQTISQPYTIAMMLSLLDLKKNQKVIEAGSGSGYVLALISKIIGNKGKVFGLELVSDLVMKSRRSLKSYSNVEVYNKNASLGLPDKAPFDRILVSAACKKVPKILLNQLKDRGILVAPVGTPHFEQSLFVIKREKDKFVTKKEIPGFIFVPFIE